MQLHELDNIAKAVLKFSPELATALTGPVGGMVVTLIANALGISSTDSNAIINNINNDADIQVKLLSIQNDLTKYRLSIAATDTENARQFQLNEEKIGKSSKMPIIITVFIMITFSITLFLLFCPLSTEQQNSTLIGTMVGLLTREFMQACRYYLGGDATDS